MSTLGLDIGGTHVRALWLNEGSVRTLGVWSTPERTQFGPCLREILAQTPSDPERVGLGFAASVSAGVVSAWPNRPEYRDLPIAELLQRWTGCAPVIIDDCAAGAWAEHRIRTARDDSTQRSTVYVALGTGIGAGAVFGDELYLGATGQAFELGHVPIVSDAQRLCGCGQYNCLQLYAGGRALAQRAQALGIAPSMLTAAAISGSRAVIELFRFAASALAEVLAPLLRQLDPERVIIGGGLSAAGQALLGPLRERLQSAGAYGHRLAQRVERARLGTWSSALGAALYVEHVRGLPLQPTRLEGGDHA